MSAFKYRHIEIRAFNEHPNEPGSFYCTVLLPDQVMTQDQLLKMFVAPAFHAVHARLIPDMPDPSKDYVKFLDWERTYFDPTVLAVS